MNINSVPVVSARHAGLAFGQVKPLAKAVPQPLFSSILDEDPKVFYQRLEKPLKELIASFTKKYEQLEISEVSYDPQSNRMDFGLALVNESGKTEYATLVVSVVNTTGLLGTGKPLLNFAAFYWIPPQEGEKHERDALYHLRLQKAPNKKDIPTADQLKPYYVTPFHKIKLAIERYSQSGWSCYESCQDRASEAKYGKNDTELEQQFIRLVFRLIETTGKQAEFKQMLQSKPTR